MMRTALVCTVLSALVLSAGAQNAPAESTVVIRPKIATYSFSAMPKDPVASALFSATICGSGQIYNREYLRGIITGAAFWASFFGAEYLLVRWQRLNTDTIYLRDYYDENIMHPVAVPKPDSAQVGLPTGEKALLLSAVIIGVSAYIFGIIDSYNGAKRFNAKLMASSGVRPELYCELGLRRNAAGVRLSF